jgi:hypothetical protein
LVPKTDNKTVAPAGLKYPDKLVIVGVLGPGGAQPLHDGTLNCKKDIIYYIYTNNIIYKS